MTKSTKFSPEVRERAVRMVLGQGVMYSLSTGATALLTLVMGSVTFFSQENIARYLKEQSR